MFISNNSYIYPNQFNNKNSLTKASIPVPSIKEPVGQFFWKIACTFLGSPRELSIS